MRANSRHLTDRELLAFIDRELPTRRHAHADAHLACCAECRARRDQIDGAIQGAAIACERDAQPAADAIDARVRLKARIRSTAAVSDASWTFRLLSSATRTPRWLRGAAIFAAVVLLVRAAPFGRPPADGLPAIEIDARPIASVTPGAVWTMNAAELCVGPVPDHGEISDAIRRDVLRRYQMDDVPPAEYELDYLITPELGGSADARNLWPQRYASRVWNAHVKDQLERLLPQLVCRGEMDLATAQREIAEDWVAAYKRHFRTSSPIHEAAGLIVEIPATP
jgi:hypothetical protein